MPPQLNDPTLWLPPVAEATVTLLRSTPQTEPELLLRAAIALALNLSDRLEVADSVPAFAIARLVEVERAAGKRLVAERALIAKSLGDGEAAARLAVELPEGPFKAFLEYADESLERRSRGGSGTLLWLRRLVQAGRDSEALQTIQRFRRATAASIEAVAIQLEATTFGAQARSAMTCELPLELHLARLAGADTKVLDLRLEGAVGLDQEVNVAKELDPALRKLLGTTTGEDASLLEPPARLDRWLTRLDHGGASSAPASSVALLHAEALVLSCLGMAVEFEFQKRSAAPESRRALLRRLATMQRPLSLQLSKWAEGLDGALNAPDQSAAALRLVSALDRLGGRPVAALLAPFSSSSFGNDMTPVRVARALAPRLDGRAVHQELRREIVAGGLLDRRYFEHALAEWVRLDGRARPELSGWVESWKTLGQNATAADRDRLREEEMRAVLGEEVDDWTARARLVERLVESKRLDEAAATVAEWVRLHPKERGFGYEWASSALAAIALARGDVEQAARAWEPVSSSFKYSTIEQGVRVAVAARDFARARELAERGSTRYPTAPHAVALRLEVAWLETKPDEAKEFFERAISRLPAGGLEPIAAAFVRAHEGKPIAETTRSLLLLREAGADPALVESVAAHFKDAKKYEECALAYPLAGGSAMQSARNSVFAYACIDAQRGTEAARRWFDARVPVAMHPVAAGFAFEQRQSTLLAALDVSGPPSDSSDFVWALRAADAVRGGIRDPALSSHFAADTRFDRYHAIGRYLLGFATEEQLLGITTSSRVANEVAFYLGVRAEAEGRIADAIVWYRASVDTDERRSHEFSMSRAALGRIYSHPLLLEAQAAKALGSPPSPSAQ